MLAEHQLVVGETVLGEVERVLRAKFKMPQAVARETIAFLRSQAAVVSGAPELGVRLRDRDDEPVVAEAAEGLAAVLVTGDRDLLDAAGKLPIRIISPRNLWEELRHPEEGPVAP